MSLTLTNVSYYRNEQLIQNQNITINNNIISSIENDIKNVNTEDLVAPGFIDLQIYGSGGRLFSAVPTVESLNIIEDDLLKKGTTGFLICMATNTPEVFNKGIEAAKAHQPFARNCLGIHLEGPYLNPKRLGAHIPEYVRKATLDEVKALVEFGDGLIKMITIAPEVQDDAVVQYLLDQGIVVSLGHSDADYEQALAAYNCGITTTTHLFNAMSPIHHRQPGIPTAVFNHQTACASIIVDGIHVDYQVVKFAKKLLKERLFLITDAVTACDSGPYQHLAKGDKFVMPDGTLSGSSLTMLQAVKNCTTYCDIALSEALKMASLYPAKIMGIENLTGLIEVNMQANLVLLHQDLSLKGVIFNGQQISI